MASALTRAAEEEEKHLGESHQDNGCVTFIAVEVQQSELQDKVGQPPGSISE